MLMKRLLSRENLLKAIKQVEKNKGSHGVDEMPVKSLRKKYWRIACSPILHRTLDLAYWQEQGLKSIKAQYNKNRQT
jgi:hypothetical protein